MANDRKVTGKKYRVLTNAANRAWDVLSFWTHSSDVEMADGQMLDKSFEALKENVDSNTNIVGELADDLSMEVSSAPLYSNTNKYKKGDIVNFNGSFYYCNTDIDTPEEFNLSHWTLITGKVKLKTGIDSNGNYGYVKLGADSVTPFSSAGLWIPELKLYWNISYQSSDATGTNTMFTTKVAGGSRLTIEKMKAGSNVDPDYTTGEYSSSIVFRDKDGTQRLIIYSINSLNQETKLKEYTLKQDTVRENVSLDIPADADMVRFELIGRPPVSKDQARFDKLGLTITNLKISRN